MAGHSRVGSSEDQGLKIASRYCVIVADGNTVPGKDGKWHWLALLARSAGAQSCEAIRTVSNLSQDWLLWSFVSPVIWKQRPGKSVSPKVQRRGNEKQGYRGNRQQNKPPFHVEHVVYDLLRRSKTPRAALQSWRRTKEARSQQIKGSSMHTEPWWPKWPKWPWSVLLLLVDDLYIKIETNLQLVSPLATHRPFETPPSHLRHTLRGNSRRPDISSARTNKHTIPTIILHVAACQRHHVCLRGPTTSRPVRPP